MKYDIALQFSWCYEIRKQHSNIVRLLVFTRLNGIQTFDIWLTRSNTMLTHANRLKRHDARKKRYAFACIQTTMQTSNSDWYQIAQRITCSSNSFLLENYTLKILQLKLKLMTFSWKGLLRQNIFTMVPCIHCRLGLLWKIGHYLVVVLRFLSLK